MTTTAPHEAEYIAPLGDRVTVIPRCGLPSLQPTPCGPCCDVNGSWQSLPHGIHASALDADTVVDYWVTAIREDCEGFVDDFSMKLTIGAGFGKAVDMLKCWLSQYIPDATLVNYADWDSYLDDWQIEDEPF